MKLRGKRGNPKTAAKVRISPLPAVSAQHLLLLTFLPLGPSFPSPLCPFSALLTACGDCESDGFILLPFLGDFFVRQNVVCGSSIILIIVLQFLEEIPSDCLYFCPFLGAGVILVSR